MSVRRHRFCLDALQVSLRKAEADPRAETPTHAALKYVLRERIAKLESTQHGGGADAARF